MTGLVFLGKKGSVPFSAIQVACREKGVVSTTRQTEALRGTAGDWPISLVPEDLYRAGVGGRGGNNSGGGGNSGKGKKPKFPLDDPSSLMKDGKLDYNDIQEWANNKNLPPGWKPNPKDFPDGGFSYKTTDGVYDYTIHGHGPNPKAKKGNTEYYGYKNSTASIVREPVGVGGKQNTIRWHVGTSKSRQGRQSHTT